MAKAPKTKNTKKSKTSKPKITWRENLLIGLISTCAICTIVALVIESAFDPQHDAELTIERLANEYYVNYYYPAIIDKDSDNPTTILESYNNQGLPVIRLRQLLSQTAHPEAESHIQNKFYRCDTNKTFVRYFPVVPYGAHDYNLQITYDCEKSVSD